MDQNSTNDSDKRNWRERLGIGQKEMPRISDDFNRASEPPMNEGRRENHENSETRHPQPVARPAPMAPRPQRQVPPQAPRQPQHQPPQQGQHRQLQEPQVEANRPMRGNPPPQDPALAERLRNQRAAAERLAEQRVVAAKERAEAARAKPPGPAYEIEQGSHGHFSSTEQPYGQPQRPKFSFAAEEEVRGPEAPLPHRETWQPAHNPALQRPPISQPPAPASHLVPPRPALGGERGVPPRGSALPPPNPSYRPQPPQAPQGYRPIDPATGYPGGGQRGYAPSYQPPPGFDPHATPDRQRGPSSLQPGGGQPAPGYGGPRFAPEQYRQPPEPAGYMPPAPVGYPTGQPRGARKEVLRAPAPVVEEEFDEEIFEEPQQPRLQRPRASAQDYNQAYRDQDPYYESKARGRGPWLTLLVLLLLALLVFGGFFIYNAFFKGTSGTIGNGTPVVNAPTQQPKIIPDQTAGGNNDSGVAVQTPSGKIIFDRIVEDHEVVGTNQIVPTEEAPVAPPSTNGMPGMTGQPAANAPQPLPGVPGAPAATDDTEPLAMPPPPGGGMGPQGSIPDPNTTQAVAINPSSAVPAAQQAVNQTAQRVNNGLRGMAQQAAQTTEQISEGLNAAANGTAGAATATQASPPSASAPAIETEEIVAEEAVSPTKPKSNTAKNQAAAKAKTVASAGKAVSGNTKNLGSAPVVLVPPANPTSQAGQAQGASLATEEAMSATAPNTPSAPPPAAQPKKKTLFGMLNGSNEGDAAATAADVTPQQQATAPQAAPPQAATPPAPKAPAAAAPNTGNGYYVKLSSFRSEGEARADYTRLKAKNSGVVGAFAPVIIPSSVGGTPRYQLALGPARSREEASKLCSSLIASGERDCTIKAP